MMEKVIEDKRIEDVDTEATDLTENECMLLEENQRLKAELSSAYSRISELEAG